MTDEAGPLIRFDVSDAVGEHATLAATYYSAPTSDSGSNSGSASGVLVCLPGGTYNRAYWHLDIPGSPGYNFAEYAAQHGYSVMAIDPLGTGDSSRPARDIDLKDIAAALAGATAALPDLTDITGRPVVVAHSLGGHLAILQQAAFTSYAAMAILGCTNQHVAPLNLDAGFIARAANPAGRAELVEQLCAAIPEPYVKTSRGGLQSWFHLHDVPPAVVEADQASTLSVVPRRFGAAAVPGITADEAALIDVPVFLGYGVVDVSPEPRAEARFYRRSPDITTVVLPSSAHCHNMASSRHRLWNRLLSWVDGVMQPIEP